MMKESIFRTMRHRPTPGFESTTSQIC